MYESFDRNELDSAQLALDDAKALNPQQVGLWSTYALLDVRRGRDIEAIAALQNELKLHPEQTNVYILLEGEQRKLGLRSDREATLRAWSAARPTDPYPLTELIFLKVEDGDAAGAVKEAAAIPASSPVRRDRLFSLQLGRALLASGDQKAGAEMMTGLLKQPDDRGVWNNVAYNLAKANVELPAAEEGSRKALAAVVEQSRTTTLTDKPEVLRARRMMLSSNWDTLGFVLFREGKLDEALKYARAAWTNTPSDEVGEHAGDILAAQGNKAAALTAYELALATIPGGSDPASTRGLAKALRERIDGLRKSGISSGVTDPTGESGRDEDGEAWRGGGERQRIGHRISSSGVSHSHCRWKPLEAAPSGATVPGAAEMIAKADLSALMVPGSGAVIVRTGTVTCTASGCVLTIDAAK